MTDAPSAYPLAWPPGWPRTEAAKRERWPQAEKLSVPASLQVLQRELHLLGAKNVVLSSNVTLGVQSPADPGVVAYALYDKRQIAIPCDRWTNVAGNLRAIAKTIEAMRGMERWGAKHMIAAMFQGFTAINAPGHFDWRAILGIKPDASVTVDLVQQRRRELAATHHPDRGGDPDRMAQINQAADAALRELRA